MRAKISSGKKKRKPGEGISFILLLVLLFCQLNCYKDNKKKAALENEGLLS